MGTGSDRFQVLVSLQDGKLGVAHLDGVERVSRAHFVVFLLTGETYFTAIAAADFLLLSDFWYTFQSFPD